MPARFSSSPYAADGVRYGPDRPLDAADVLGRFLRSLGVESAGVPDGADERATRFRSEVDGRRMLLVLDNAGDVAQVRPLLPGSASCFTVVTSRDTLAGAIARDGARRVEVPLLPAKEALDLLGSLVDGPRMDSEPDSARVLVEQSCGLPLALRLVAELAVARPTTALAELAAELADEQSRLDRLDAGDDPRSALRAVFSWSVGQLGAPAARAYRLLGLHPGAEFGLPAASALVDGDATAALDELVRAHLVERDGDRFRMHDLLRAYALDVVESTERKPAVSRMLGSYVDGTVAAADLLFPAERDRRPEASGPPPVGMREPADARAWLDLERANLVEASALAARDGFVRPADAFSRTLWRYLFTNNHYSDALLVHRSALEAGRRAGDRAVEATGRHNLGTVLWRLGRFDEALESYGEALRLRGEIGDAAGEAQTLNNMGIVHMGAGRLTAALECYEPVLAFRRSTGDLMGEARTLGNLGTVYQRLGRRDDGLRACERVLELFRVLGDRWGEAGALNNLALVHQRLGRYAEAAQESAAALRLYGELGDRGGRAMALGVFAMSERGAGRPVEAVEHFRRSVELLQEIGDPGREGEVLNELAGTLAALERFDEALAERRRALVLARRVGNRDEEALARSGLAELAVRRGDRAEAAEHWRAALAYYEDLDLPQAAGVRHRLTLLDGE